MSGQQQLGPPQQEPPLPQQQSLLRRRQQQYRTKAENDMILTRVTEMHDQGMRNGDIARALQITPVKVTSCLNITRPDRQSRKLYDHSAGRDRSEEARSKAREAWWREAKARDKRERQQQQRWQQQQDELSTRKEILAFTSRVPGLITIFTREMEQENYRNSLAHEAEEAAAAGDRVRLRRLRALSTQLGEIAAAVSEIIEDPAYRVQMAQTADGRDDIRAAGGNDSSAGVSSSGNAAVSGAGAAEATEAPNGIWRDPDIIQAALISRRAGEGAKKLSRRAGISRHRAREALIYAEGLENGRAAPVPEGEG